MMDERWNGFRLESAASELGGPVDRRSNHIPLDRTIDGVVFEPCGVLYDDSAWRRWLWQLLGRMGLSSSYTPLFRVWDCEFQEEIWSGRLDLWTGLGQFLLSAGMSRPDIDEVIAASRAKFRRFDQDTRPFPDVQATVRRLHAQGIQIAVIADARRGTTRIRERLERVGIAKLVRLLFSQPKTEVGGRAELQQESLAALPGRPANWAFVGRQPAALQFAHRRGMLTVAFNHDADAEADLYIEQFSQLTQLLTHRGSPELAARPAKAA